MIRLFLPACLLTFLLSLSAWAGNWPQWRGPTNDGHSPETNLPTEWSADKNIVWKCKLPGRGGSTPCVWEDKIFLTALDGQNRDLLCIGTDGKEKWKAVLATGGKGSYRGDEGDDASASCSCDGKHVWAFVGNGQLVCYTMDGKPVWTKDLQEYGKFGIQFGIHWTPVLFKDRLYLQVMHRGAQKLVCLEAATGKQVWAVDRKGAGKGESLDVYASAFIWEGKGGPLLIAHGNDFCTAHTLDAGAEVWRVGGLNPEERRDWRFVASPLVTPDLIVIPSCKNGPTVGINPVGAKGIINEDSPNELWRVKTTPDVVSPLLVDGQVYLMSDGPLTALDAKTGKSIYRQAVGKGLHRPNMVAADGKIYILGREGTTAVVKPGPKCVVLATNALPDKFYGSPAISGGRLYLRGWEYLWAVGSK